MKTTRQGVPDLNTKPKPHAHKHVPYARVNRSGCMVTTMRCHCGHEDEPVTDGPNQEYDHLT